MAPLENVWSALRAFRSRFRNTGILARTIFRYRKRHVLSAPTVDPFGPGTGEETAAYSPPDFKSLSDPIPPDVAPLAKKYAERAVHLVALGSMVSRQDEIIAAAIFEFFQRTATLRAPTKNQIRSWIGEFRTTYLDCPVTNNNGGANFPTALNIFLITRTLSPRLIVECGVFKGASSYFLKAASPGASQYSFDPNLAQVVHKTPGVNYSSTDWMHSDIRNGSPSTGLCYFDDHQNQATRIIQAHKRGFRHLILDDAWPIEIPGSGWPPTPSIDMILNNWLEVGESVRWIEGTKMWTYTQTDESYRLMETARACIKGAYDMPSLYRQTGVAPTSAGKYVELV